MANAPPSLKATKDPEINTAAAQRHLRDSRQPTGLNARITDCETKLADLESKMADECAKIKQIGKLDAKVSGVDKRIARLHAKASDGDVRADEMLTFIHAKTIPTKRSRIPWNLLRSKMSSPGTVPRGSIPHRAWSISDVFGSGGDGGGDGGGGA
ncbi:hypothetical protein B0T26DRAFT_871059 [Lasiosphaeria miniovina]|uniref:Uncharacterized protein n=1 Tax=Lasiosphaeria miniovina TaxID=1954250 RepID=A0AA40AW54_9PEZI|nr:uncharacterized protein B0T26DRAFT_871059 [Lasiosphaeria miniovina]KAK0723133.1 hypothetical protein B0T26DRAFT_871059 [Lasiosphaeria miniovina]